MRVAEMLKFPRKEEGKKEKETERRGKEVKEREGGRGQKEGEKGKGAEWGAILEKKKKACKKKWRLACLLPGRKIFLGPWIDVWKH